MAYATIAMSGAKPRSKRKVIRLRAGEVCARALQEASRHANLNANLTDTLVCVAESC